MGLTGTLKSGAKIELLPACDFFAPRAHYEDLDCGDTARYRVTMASGHVMHACEAHVEELWERDEAQDGGVARSGTTEQIKGI